MELMKKAGLMFLGACVAAIIIFGIYHDKRITRLEILTNQIVQVIQQSQKPELPVNKKGQE
jgi:hypothetical protein